jgi:hypothetical protein
MWGYSQHYVKKQVHYVIATQIGGYYFVFGMFLRFYKFGPQPMELLGDDGTFKRWSLGE